MRVPDVEDENDAQLVAVVPGLVLDRVVEHPRPARDPLPRHVADPESAGARDDEGKVRDEADIGHAGVRWDPGPGFEQGEHRGGGAGRWVPPGRALERDAGA